MRHGDGPPEYPRVYLYGGSSRPGHFEGKEVSNQGLAEAIGGRATGTVSSKTLDGLERAACPGAGTCGERSRRIRWVPRSRL